MRVLELAWKTPREWAADALEEPLALLADHAWCELGAASAAQGLVARHPDVEPLCAALIPLAAEELRHFRRVERLLRARGGKLETARRNPYAEGLLAKVERTQALLDRLLVCALIEARSLERFTLLAEETEDLELAAFFAELGPAEAAHASLFLELAHELFPADAGAPERVAARLGRWVAREARLIQGLPRGARIHSGWAGWAGWAGRFELLPKAEQEDEPPFELRPRRTDERPTEIPT